MVNVFSYMKTFTSNSEICETVARSKVTKVIIVSRMNMMLLSSLNVRRKTIPKKSLEKETATTNTIDVKDPEDETFDKEKENANNIFH